MREKQKKTLKVIKTGSKGYGLATDADIKAGDFVIEYIGEVITKDECQRRLKECQSRGVTNFYMLTIEPNEIIDAAAKSNRARYFFFLFFYYYYL
jgi:SET domain-containing protein